MVTHRLSPQTKSDNENLHFSFSHVVLGRVWKFYSFSHWTRRQPNHLTSTNGAPSSNQLPFYKLESDQEVPEVGNISKSKRYACYARNTLYVRAKNCLPLAVDIPLYVDASTYSLQSFLFAMLLTETGQRKNAMPLCYFSPQTDYFVALTDRKFTVFKRS